MAKAAPKKSAAEKVPMQKQAAKSATAPAAKKAADKAAGSKKNAPKAATSTAPKKATRSPVKSPPPAPEPAPAPVSRRSSASPFDAKFLEVQRELLLEERAKLMGQAESLEG